MLAYILISLREADEHKVLDKVMDMKGIKEAHILFGEWDIIAKIEAKSAEDLGTFVMENIRSLPEVRLTSSLIVAK